MQPIELVEIDKLSAWDKNPRERDPYRFEWVKMSLAKFGFVLPVYAREDGLLYSGHQRTSAARELGFTSVPVVYLPHGDRKSERLLNVLFNLCTNDHATKADFGKKMVMDLESLEQFISLPNTTDLYPCLRQQELPSSTFWSQLTEDKVSYMTKMFAQILFDLGVVMPVVTDSAGSIINGYARLKAATVYRIVTYPVVQVADNADALRVFLNKISMSFDLKKAFGEELRYNSFRRARNEHQRQFLGGGFWTWVFQSDVQKHGIGWARKNLVHMQGEILQRWIAKHGTTVVDFGAGRMPNTEKLKAVGINCIPFEPYAMKPGTEQISLSAARIITRNFLRVLESQTNIDSIFCSSVFNSVPFAEDREHLMVLFQALCYRGATLYLYTRSDAPLASGVFANSTNRNGRKQMAILLDSEPGTYIGEIVKTPKIQKLYSKDELIAAGRRYFHSVRFHPADGSNIGIECAGSRSINPSALIEAIKFEFDLPYPGDRRMDLVDEALDAFSQFTGIDLISHAKNLGQVQPPQ